MEAGAAHGFRESSLVSDVATGRDTEIPRGRAGGAVARAGLAARLSICRVPSPSTTTPPSRALVAMMPQPPWPRTPARQPRVGHTLLYRVSPFTGRPAYACMSMSALALPPRWRSRGWTEIA
jgi:hypothetical protein